MSDFSHVAKFGGAALRDGAAVRRACAIVAQRVSERPLVVVSAHEGVTSLLDEVAHRAAQGRREERAVHIRHRTLCRELGLDPEILRSYLTELSYLLSSIARRGILTPKDRDAILSLGERMSARIVARAMRDAGVFATPVDAFDLGLVTEGEVGALRPRSDSRERVRRSLAEVAGVPVVTGFLARDDRGRLTTLGRNGSDWSASWLAEAVNARELFLWKAVHGVMTADPALVPNARVLARLSWRDALELARRGAEVLHPESIEPARRARIRVCIKNVADPEAPGTLLVDELGARPAGIACRSEADGACLAIVGGADHDAIVRASRRHLTEAGVCFETRDDDPRSFLVAHGELSRAARALHAAWFETAAHGAVPAGAPRDRE